jgi:hypothetical protein
MGDVESLLELPLSLLNRLTLLTDEEGFMERFFSFKGFYITGGGRH